MEPETRFTSSLVHSVCSNFLTGVALSFLALLSSDVLFSLPKLSGFWEVEVTVEQTNYAPFEGLKLRYDVALVQQLAELQGTGEKDSEKPAGQSGWTSYSGAGRTRVEVMGYIQRQFLSRDDVILHFRENGLRRETTTFMELSMTGDGVLIGTFSSTAAGSSGSVGWARH